MNKKQVDEQEAECDATEYAVPHGWLQHTSDKQNEWYKYVYEMIRLQLWIDDRNILPQNEDNQWKTFNAIPQNGNDLHHIRFDTEGWIDVTNLLLSNSFKTQRNAKGAWDTDDMNNFWKRFVDIEKLNKPSQKFGFSFTTNGISAHLVRPKRCATVDEQQQDQQPSTSTSNNNNSNSRPPVIIPPDVQAAYETEKRITKIYGDDPGMKVMVASTCLDLETGIETSYRLKTKQWHHRSGTFRRRTKLFRYTGDFEKRCKQIRENHDEYPQQPSPKSRNFDKYLDYQIRVFNESCEVKYQDPVTRLKFDKYVEREKMFHVIAKEMTGLAKKIENRADRTIIYAVGDARFAAGSPIKGHLRMPIRGIIAILNKYYVLLVDVDEFRTSMLCSRCHCMLQKPKYHKPESRNIKDRFLVCPNCKPANNVLPVPVTWVGRIHNSKKHLPNDGMHFEFTADKQQQRMNRTKGKYLTIIWDRDNNASRNMIYKTLCALTRTPMHHHFSRDTSRPTVLACTTNHK
ncbi:uncharacterized protein LOC116351226 [Contarinia nasturtii]|nr:uncharacterized protein LOC116351226 [Contarinia nasturtii]